MLNFMEIKTFLKNRYSSRLVIFEGGYNLERSTQIFGKTSILIGVHGGAISGGSRIFPRGGREPSRGGVNTPNFPENCMKSKEFGRPGGGRASLTPPPRSANGYVQPELCLQ